MSRNIVPLPPMAPPVQVPSVVSPVDSTFIGIRDIHPEIYDFICNGYKKLKYILTGMELIHESFKQ